MAKNQKSRIKSRPTRLLFVLFSVLCFFSFICLPSCNVTRVITNESKYTTRGDTVVMIQTKTIETYDATKKL